MTKEFVKSRIAEQERYIESIQSFFKDEVGKKRLIDSATERLDFFRRKLEEIEIEEELINQTSLDKVKEFHELFEHPIGLDPSHKEPLKIRQLRIKLLFEELVELTEAGDCRNTMHRLALNYLNQTSSLEVIDSICLFEDGDNVDKVEELDAINDLQYVLDGKKLTSGLHTVTIKAFDLIHKNNMTKAHRDIEHAKETISKSRVEGKWEMVVKDGKVLLYNADSKLTKPWDHKKVDLKHLIDGKA